MAVDQAANKLQESVKSTEDAAKAAMPEIDPEAKPIESQPKEEEPKTNGEDKSAEPSAEPTDTKPREKIDGVPIDKDGKRPSDKASIDFDKLEEQLSPEEFRAVKQRFNELYRQVKATDRYLDTLHQDFDARIKELTEQESSKSKDIENVKTILSELSTKDAAAQQQMQLQELQKAKSQAYSDLDFDRVSELDTQIFKLLSQPQKVELPKIELPEKEEKEVKEETTELPSLTPREQAYVAEWTNEVDANGQPVRPWAQSWHPLYNYALGQTEAMLRHPQLQGADLQTVLQTVDQVMMAQLQGEQEQPKEEVKETKPKEPPEVLQADQNLRSKKTEDKIYLREDQKQVARRLFPKMSPEDAEKKYLASLTKIQKMQK